MKYFIISLFFFTTSLPAFGQITADYKAVIKTHRKQYKADFLENERSPLVKKELKHLRFFEPNQKYEVIAKVELTPEAKPFEMATYSGETRLYRKYAQLNFEVDGQQQHLAVYQNLRLQSIPSYKDKLFLLFKDLTNGETTYGGGRYIDLNMKDIENATMLVDFNKCYNPWCHYKDGYSCPIPPAENHLDIAIPAGERNFAKKKKH